MSVKGRGAGDREQLRSAISYGLVAVLSVLVVCGASLRDQLQRGAASSAGASAAPGAPLPTRPEVSAQASVPRSPQGAPPVAARATVESPDVMTGALPAIPGSGLRDEPVAASVPSEAATPAVVAVPAPPPVIPARPVASPGALQADAPLVRARLLTKRLYDGPLQEVWAAFSPGVQAEWGSYEKFAAFRAGGRQAYGAETRVLSEGLTRSGGVTYYTRTATFERGPRDGWTVIMGLDSAGQVQEFGIVGAALLPERLRELSR